MSRHSLTRITPQSLAALEDLPRSLKVFGLLHSERKTEWWIFIGTLFLYALTISENLAIAHDSSMYLNWIEHKVHLYMPHHLLYTISMRSWLLVVQFFFPTADKVLIVTLPNVLAGATSALFIYRILRYRAHVPELLAVLGTTGAAFSFGFWFYSIAVEVYLIPLCFLLATFYLATRPGMSIKHAVLVGTVHSMGILFHQSHVLFFPVVLLLFYLTNKHDSHRKWKLMLVYTLSSGGLSIIAYLLVILFYIDPTNAKEMWSWLTLYSHTMSDTWNGLSLTTLLKACVGIGRSFIGSHFMFAVPSLREEVMTALHGHWFNDEIFLVNGLSQSTGGALIIGAMLIGAGITFLLIRSIVLKIRTATRPSSATLGLIAWIVAYSCFFFFWDPTNCEFWIPQTTCIWMLLAITVHRFPSALSRCVLAGTVVLIGIVNYFGSVQFAQSKENDYYYQTVRPFIAEPATNAIVLSNSWTERMYFDHYSSMRHEAMDEMFTQAGSTDRIEGVRQKLVQLEQGVRSKGGHIYILPDARMMPETALSLAKATQAEVDSAWRPFEKCLTPATVNGMKLFELRYSP